MIERVAIVIERAEAALGGAERSMLEVAQALSSLGVQVDLLAAKGGASSGNIHVLCRDAPGKRVRLSVFGDALRRHVSKVRYDIIHSVLPFEFADVYQPRGGTYAESIRRNAASYPDPLIRRWKRITAFTNLRRAELLRAERRLCRGSDGPVIAALSHYVADQLREHYGTDPNRIVLTLNGIQMDSATDSASARRVRRQFVAHFGDKGIGKPALYLFAAHNFRLKGLDPLIRAMQTVCAARTERPIGLIVAGAGRSDKYHKLARRLGVESHILFLGPVGRIRDILPAIDVGILPTFYDPSSRFILEALAAGKPVITTRFNGATDLFTPGRHGEVIDSPDNVRALADAIRQFTNAARIEQCSRAIREDDIRAKVSIHRVARETFDLYHSILKRRDGQPEGARECHN